AATSLILSGKYTLDAEEALAERDAKMVQLLRAPPVTGQIKISSPIRTPRSARGVQRIKGLLRWSSPETQIRNVRAVLGQIKAFPVPAVTERNNKHTLYTALHQLSAVSSQSSIATHLSNLSKIKEQQNTSSPIRKYVEQFIKNINGQGYENTILSASEIGYSDNRIRVSPLDGEQLSLEKMALLRLKVTEGKVKIYIDYIEAQKSASYSEHVNGGTEFTTWLLQLMAKAFKESVEVIFYNTRNTLTLTTINQILPEHFRITSNEDDDFYMNILNLLLKGFVLNEEQRDVLVERTPLFRALAKANYERLKLDLEEGTVVVKGVHEYKSSSSPVENFDSLTPEEIIQAIRTKMIDVSDQELRSKIVALLANTIDIIFLGTLLRDHMGVIRHVVIEVLEQLETPETTKLILDVLKGEEIRVMESVRLAIAKVLGRKGSKMLPFIEKELMGKENFRVSQYGIEALALINTKQAIDLIVAALDYNEFDASVALIEKGHNVVDALISTLQSSKEPVRVAVVKVLDEIHAREPIEGYTEILTALNLENRRSENIEDIETLMTDPEYVDSLPIRPQEIFIDKDPGYRNLVKLFMKAYRANPSRPFVILVKGNPGTRKTTLITSFKSVLVGKGFKVAVEDDREIAITETITYKDLLFKNKGTNVIFYEGVRRLPADIEYLDIFVELMADQDTRFRRIEAATKEQGFRAGRKSTKAVVNYSNRYPDIVIDNSNSILTPKDIENILLNSFDETASSPISSRGGYLVNAQQMIKQGDSVVIRAVTYAEHSDQIQRVVLYSNHRGEKNWQDHETPMHFAENNENGEAVYETVVPADRSFEYTVRFEYTNGEVRWADLHEGENGKIAVYRIFMGHVVFIGMEFAPFSKEGGQGDVTYELPKTLTREAGKILSVIIPYFKKDKKIQNLELSHQLGEVDIKEVEGFKKTFIVKIRKKIAIDPDKPEEMTEITEVKEVVVTAVKTMKDNINVYLLKTDDEDLFNNLYSDNKSVEFNESIILSFASLELIKHLNLDVKVIQSNDHHTALIPLLMRTKYSDIFARTGSVFTIHNIGYQGVYDLSWYPELGLGDWTIFKNQIIRSGVINMMAAAVSLKGKGNYVVTVSPTYAREIRDSLFEIDRLLQEQGEHFTGILNGIDFSVWNPATDKKIPYNYSIEEGIDKVRKARAKNKQELQELLSLGGDLRRVGLTAEDHGKIHGHLNPGSKRLLLGVVSRLVTQKQLDIYAQMFEDILNGTKESLTVDVVVLASANKASDDKATEEKFKEVARRFKERGHDIAFSFVNAYSDTLARWIYASADALIIPSDYEPSGLTQMIAMRYGAVPIVRFTGGLVDTVFELGAKWNGFGFDGVYRVLDNPQEDAIRKRINTDQLYEAVARAVNVYDYTPLPLEHYQSDHPDLAEDITDIDPTTWENIIIRGMSADNSWERSIKEYQNMYVGSVEELTAISSPMNTSRQDKFFETIQMFSQMTADKLEELVALYAQAKDIIDDRRVFDTFKQALSQLTARKKELTYEYRFKPEFCLNCSFYTQKALELMNREQSLLSNRLNRVHLSSIKDPAKRSSTTNHEYFTIFFAQQLWIIDLTADQFQIPISIRYMMSYNDLGIVVLPSSEVERRKDDFWMYNTSSPPMNQLSAVSYQNINNEQRLTSNSLTSYHLSLSTKKSSSPMEELKEDWVINRKKIRVYEKSEIRLPFLNEMIIAVKGYRFIALRNRENYLKIIPQEAATKITEQRIESIKNDFRLSLMLDKENKPLLDEYGQMKTNFKVFRDFVDVELIYFQMRPPSVWGDIEAVIKSRKGLRLLIGEEAEEFLEKAINQKVDIEVFYLGTLHPRKKSIVELIDVSTLQNALQQQKILMIDYLGFKAYVFTPVIPASTSSPIKRREKNKEVKRKPDNHPVETTRRGFIKMIIAGGSILTGGLIGFRNEILSVFEETKKSVEPIKTQKRSLKEESLLRILKALDAIMVRIKTDVFAQRKDIAEIKMLIKEIRTNSQEKIKIYKQEEIQKIFVVDVMKESLTKYAVRGVAEYIKEVPDNELEAILFHEMIHLTQRQMRRGFDAREIEEMLARGFNSEQLEKDETLRNNMKIIIAVTMQNETEAGIAEFQYRRTLAQDRKQNVYDYFNEILAEIKHPILRKYYNYQKDLFLNEDGTLNEDEFKMVRTYGNINFPVGKVMPLIVMAIIEKAVKGEDKLIQSAVNSKDFSILIKHKGFRTWSLSWMNNPVYYNLTKTNTSSPMSQRSAISDQLSAVSYQNTSNEELATSNLFTTYHLSLSTKKSSSSLREKLDKIHTVFSKRSQQIRGSPKWGVFTGLLMLVSLASPAIVQASFVDVLSAAASYSVVSAIFFFTISGTLLYVSVQIIRRAIADKNYDRVALTAVLAAPLMIYTFSLGVQMSTLAVGEVLLIIMGVSITAIIANGLILYNGINQIKYGQSIFKKSVKNKIYKILSVPSGVLLMFFLGAIYKSIEIVDMPFYPDSTVAAIKIGLNKNAPETKYITSLVKLVNVTDEIGFIAQKIPRIHRGFEKIQDYRKEIQEIALDEDVEPAFLAAVVFEEIIDMDALEELRDLFLSPLRKTSVGLPQIHVENIRMLFKDINGMDSKDLWDVQIAIKLVDDKSFAIRAAAKYLRYLGDYGAKVHGLPTKGKIWGLKNKLSIAASYTGALFDKKALNPIQPPFDISDDVFRSKNQAMLHAYRVRTSYKEMMLPLFADKKDSSSPMSNQNFSDDLLRTIIRNALKVRIIEVLDLDRNIDTTLKNLEHVKYKLDVIKELESSLISIHKMVNQYEKFEKIIAALNQLNEKAIKSVEILANEVSISKISEFIQGDIETDLKIYREKVEGLYLRAGYENEQSGVNFRTWILELGRLSKELSDYIAKHQSSDASSPMQEKIIISNLQWRIDQASNTQTLEIAAGSGEIFQFRYVYFENSSRIPEPRKNSIDVREVKKNQYVGHVDFFTHNTQGWINIAQKLRLEALNYALFVHPTYRSRKIGKVLVTLALLKAKELGVNEVRVQAILEDAREVYVNPIFDSVELKYLERLYDLGKQTAEAMDGIRVRSRSNSEVRLGSSSPMRPDHIKIIKTKFGHMVQKQENHTRHMLLLDEVHNGFGHGILSEVEKNYFFKGVKRNGNTGLTAEISANENRPYTVSIKSMETILPKEGETNKLRGIKFVLNVHLKDADKIKGGRTLTLRKILLGNVLSIRNLARSQGLVDPEARLDIEIHEGGESGLMPKGLQRALLRLIDKDITQIVMHNKQNILEGRVDPHEYQLKINLEQGLTVSTLQDWLLKELTPYINRVERADESKLDLYLKSASLLLTNQRNQQKEFIAIDQTTELARNIIRENIITILSRAYPTLGYVIVDASGRQKEDVKTLKLGNKEVVIFGLHAQMTEEKLQELIKNRSIPEAHVSEAMYRTILAKLRQVEYVETEEGQHIAYNPDANIMPVNILDIVTAIPLEYRKKLIGVVVDTNGQPEIPVKFLGRKGNVIAVFNPLSIGRPAQIEAYLHNQEPEIIDVAAEEWRDVAYQLYLINLDRQEGLRETMLTNQHNERILYQELPNGKKKWLSQQTIENIIQILPEYIRNDLRGFVLSQEHHLQDPLKFIRVGDRVIGVLNPELAKRIYDEGNMLKIHSDSKENFDIEIELLSNHQPLTEFKFNEIFINEVYEHLQQLELLIMEWFGGSFADELLFEEYKHLILELHARLTNNFDPNTTDSEIRSLEELREEILHKEQQLQTMHSVLDIPVELYFEKIPFLAFDIFKMNLLTAQFLFSRYVAPLAGTPDYLVPFTADGIIIMWNILPFIREEVAYDMLIGLLKMVKLNGQVTHEEDMRFSTKRDPDKAFRSPRPDIELMLIAFSAYFAKKHKDFNWDQTFRSPAQAMDVTPRSTLAKVVSYVLGFAVDLIGTKSLHEPRLDWKDEARGSALGTYSSTNNVILRPLAYRGILALNRMKIVDVNAQAVKEQLYRIKRMVSMFTVTKTREDQIQDNLNWIQYALTKARFDEEKETLGEKDFVQAMVTEATRMFNIQAAEVDAADSEQVSAFVEKYTPRIKRKNQSDDFIYTAISLDGT
ncbi:MAG: glycogen/starch synthase, partial [Candidatus Omnitrophica bacterium]|nr:glycogen/starch synthase [Candidatus Omnitrophota bacterium]